MIMQAKTGRDVALAGLCLLALTACDARPENQPPAAEDVAAPTVAGETTGQLDAVPPEEPPSPEDQTETGALTPTPRRRVAVGSVAEPGPQEPPVEVEGLVITGPRDGETLGEYRARADRAFRRIDRDGDGRLDREEVTSSRLSLRTALEQGDIDLDETISPQEFGDLTTRAFQRLDADGNGVITEAEMEAGDPLGFDQGR
jgi:hypothetical protein